MATFILQVILALSLCGNAKGWYTVNYVQSSEKTIAGRTSGSESVTYTAFSIQATFTNSNVLPTEQEFQSIGHMGDKPTFVHNLVTKELKCFGFYVESCEGYALNDDIVYQQWSIGYDELIQTIDLIVKNGALVGVRAHHGDVLNDGLDMKAGGDFYFANGDYIIYRAEALNKPFVGIIYDSNTFQVLYTKGRVTSLSYYYEPIFEAVINAIKSNIPELEHFKQRYADNPMKDVAQQSCTYLKKLYGTAVNINACLYAYMMQYIVVMGDDIDQYKSHQPRNLMNMSSYDTQQYLDQVDESRDFRAVLNQISVTQQQVVQTASATGAYFVTTALFERDIAQKDREFLSGELVRLQTDAQVVLDELFKRLNRTIIYAVQLTATTILDLGARFAVAVAENMNPLKHIFGGTDLSTMLDLASQIAEAIRQAANAIRLFTQMDKFATKAYSVTVGFHSNKLSIIELERIVALAPNASEQELKDYANYYVTKYGRYTPSVTHQDIVEMIALLGSVVEEACVLIDGSQGIATSVLATIVEQQQDCLYLPSLVENLMSYYDETFEFQFTLIDALTNIVRGSIAENLASKFEEIRGQDQYDLKIAALGTAMLEMRVQDIARKHCDWLEYRHGGKRTSECSNFFFNDATIDLLIPGDEGDVVKNNMTIFAYIPTVKPSQADDEKGYPYINVSQLIATGHFTFRLPVGTDYEDFLIDHNWLPANFHGQSYNRETSYFVKVIEPYIHGLECADSDTNGHWFEITTVSGEPNRIFAEEGPPQYLLPPAQFIFQYSSENYEHGCTHQSYKNFHVKAGNQNYYRNVCVHSAGAYHGTGDKLIPSIYAPWTIILGKHHDCQLVHPKESLGEDPMVTFNLELKAVLASGIDECWPPNSRCSNSCSNDMLSYSCN